MHDELLIESVRSNRVLYDFSHPKYWDSEHKNKLWNQIGKKLNTDGTTCRSRWHNIRDQYRKTLKKTIAKKGQNAKKVPYYKYHELMSFMDGFFQEREKKEILTADDEADDFYGVQLKTDNEDAASSNSSRPESSMDTFPHAVVCLESPINAIMPPSGTQARHPLSPDRPGSPRASESTSSKEKKELSRLTSTAAYLVEYILKKSEKKPEHPIDKFLEGIAPTLRSLTPYYQNLAKSEIFATVQKYEMMMLKESHDTANSELKEANGRNTTSADNKDSVERIKEK
ncbi:transcription factor Adf-1 [Manduca sexta]|uniref:transcription factor Adf-1 n=1 Tax=Manduca sexta TaxID=7130 RepID=UPI00188EA66D|nr:transcription factor Adf-1 [Manduca sexta]